MFRDLEILISHYKYKNFVKILVTQLMTLYLGRVFDFRYG